jgi:hypothetical protein
MRLRAPWSSVIVLVGVLVGCGSSDVDAHDAEVLARRERAAEEARTAEAAREAEEARKAEEDRQVEASRKAEEARAAEAARVAEEARLAEVAASVPARPAPARAAVRAAAERSPAAKLSSERAAPRASKAPPPAVSRPATASEPATVAMPATSPETATASAPPAPAVAKVVTPPRAAEEVVATPAKPQAAEVSSPSASPVAVVKVVPPTPPKPPLPAKKVVPIDPACLPAALEDRIAAGTLAPPQVACLDASYKAVNTLSNREAVSTALIRNAAARGDTEMWEFFVRRHLQEVSDADASLVSRFAFHLYEKKPSDAAGAYRWADRALALRAAWTGATYNEKVYSLHKLRAAAAQALWRAAEEANVADPSDDNAKLAMQYRLQMMSVSKAWMAFARGTGKDASTALKLCTMAADAKTCGAS